MNTQHTLLVAILVVVVFGVGFMIGRVTASGGTITGVPSSSSGTASDANGEVERAAASESDSGSTGDGTTVVANDLTSGQRQLLGALGIDANEFTITPEMVACAEAKVGAARVEEIKNGATPSLIEGAELIACYK